MLSPNPIVTAVGQSISKQCMQEPDREQRGGASPGSPSLNRRQKRQARLGLHVKGRGFRRDWKRQVDRSGSRLMYRCGRLCENGVRFQSGRMRLACGFSLAIVFISLLVLAMLCKMVGIMCASSCTLRKLDQLNCSFASKLLIKESLKDP